MARKLRGWIRNLADGQGPPPLSVGVAATVEDSDGSQDPISQSTHQTGPLTFVHQAGSGDQALADGAGHFGWDMELSPGQITQQIVPTDPQTEYRYRFPDESAQIGKAFHSDLERLSWTGGRDGLVWNAVPDGHDPLASQWSADPTVTAQLGNWGVASFGTNMAFTLRKGIAFVGGTVFSVEMGDLAVPISGMSAAPVNNNAQDRWDLVCLNVITDPTVYNYGKQTIEIIAGIPGGGIPAHPGQPTSPIGRRLVLHALKVPGNSTAYTAAFDLRRWLWHPVTPVTTLDAEWITTQTLSTNGLHNSTLNTELAANEIKLPPGQVFTGELVFSCQVLAEQVSVDSVEWGSIGLTLVPIFEGYDVRNELVAGNGVITAGDTFRLVQAPNTVFGYEIQTVHVPIPRIASYHVDSSVSPASRVWHRLRPVIKFYVVGVGSRKPAFIYQRASLHLWPVS